MANDPHWMEHAAASMKKRGTVGKFTAKAKKAGMSVSGFAKKEKGAGGKLGKEANFARNAAKAHH